MWAGVFWGHVITLVVMAVLTPGVAVLLRFLSPARVGVLILVLVAIVLLLLFALPITAAVAVAARPCCRDCGYRFWPTSGRVGEAGQAGFPVRLALVGGVILLLPLGLGLAWLASVPGRETWTVTQTIGTRIMLAGLALGVGFLCQAILWRVLRTRMANTMCSGLVLLLPVVVLSAGWLTLTAHDHRVLSRRYDPLVRAPRFLAGARLAQLPPSAHGVATYGYSSLFSGKHCLRFAAEPNEIERFLGDSPSLQEVTCQRYSREKMRIRVTGPGDVLRGAPESPHEYFYSGITGPCWYPEDIRGAGRRYEIKLEGGPWFGEVIVDDEQHVVYVRLTR